MIVEERIENSVKLPETGYATLEYDLLKAENGLSWGLRCRMPMTGEEACAEDVTTDGNEARRIFLLMANGTVTPVTFFDVIYDLLP